MQANRQERPQLSCATVGREPRLLKRTKQTNLPQKLRDAGREQLLDSARKLLRSKTRHAVSRQEIARFAGVTPALITYYFKSNSDLILAVTEPVMREAIAKLLAAIDFTKAPEVQLRTIVRLFVDFAHDNAAILDLFIEAVLESGDERGQALIQSCLDKLGEFFNRAVQGGLVSQDLNPHLLLLAIWGMCRLVGEVPSFPLQVFGVDVDTENQKRVETEFITRFVLGGVASMTINTSEISKPQ